MLGVIFAFGALFCWMFGDFFIQKVSRVVGIWKALFFITFLGAIVMYPFVQEDVLPFLTNIETLRLLLLVSVVTLFAALFDFEALKEGKFAIIEPLLGIELPVTIGLSVIFWNERLTSTQVLLTFFVFIGIILAVTKHHKILYYHKRILEKGVIYAGIGAIGMGLMNFLTGVSSQQTHPLFTIWFIHSFLAFATLIYLCGRGEAMSMLSDFKKHFNIIIPESLFDNLSWIFYAYAMTYIPISIATTISESYIVGGVLLGVFINKERLRPHQFVGVIITIIGILALSLLTSG